MIPTVTVSAAWEPLQVEVDGDDLNVRLESASEPMLLVEISDKAPGLRVTLLADAPNVAVKTNEG